MKKKNFVLHGFTLAERICRGRLNPSPLAKFRTADKPVSESRNHVSGSEVMTGASAKEFQDAGEGSGVRGNNGFTLAEVLITLVIIGVIGALTVPALIQNTRKQEYVSALKKAYSALSQATQIIIAEEGNPKCNDGGWACSAEEIYNMYKKHMINIKECRAGAGCAPEAYKTLDNRAFINLNEREDLYKLIFAGGMIAVFQGADLDCASRSYSSEDVCANIQVDVNGMKGPNIYGRDYFVFVIKENGLYPAGALNTQCNNSYSADCAFKVLTEDAMNY